MFFLAVVLGIPTAFILGGLWLGARLAYGGALTRALIEAD